MKKIISMILAVAMMFALAVVASAEPNATFDGDGSTSAIPVTVTVIEEAPTYDVDITWPAMSFEYKLTGWNGTAYQSGTWTSGTTKSVSVQNNSSVSVYVMGTLDNGTGAENVVVKERVSVVCDTTSYAEVARGGAVGSTKSINITVSGNPNTTEAVVEPIQVKTLVVSVSTTGT